ncbi:concanavalin A-like lectin/glucanase domain-containing protein [Aspergillus pseudoustus]|uniref:Concanavalin A-like lectin/glucanase domain-containing protein n=1 Tax=Aspergillus pseudoustus TaxID=1810923 RepID=A0ABR4KYG8_9EURO
MHIQAFSLTLFSAGVSCFLSDPSKPSFERRASTEIPADSFNAFDTYWNYLYPWGDTHNGGARMDSEHVTVSDGVLTLTAEPVSGQPDPIHYLSGAIHAKSTFTVEAGGGYDLSAEFIAPVSTGTWPAFWLNAASGWPPEIDIAEWKGTGKISFNTFNTSSEVTALDIDYPSPEDWHSVKAEVRDENGSDVSVKFYLDGELVTTQYAREYVGKGLRLIINYQTEGSSGSPGPTTETTFQVRKVEVISQNS